MNKLQEQIAEAVALARVALIDKGTNRQVIDLGVLDEMGGVSDDAARGLLLMVNALLDIVETLHLVAFNACAQVAEATKNEAARMGRPPMSSEEQLQMLAVQLQKLYE